MSRNENREEEYESAGCLGVVLKLFGVRLTPPDTSTKGDSFPYKLTTQFLSPGELSFFRVLEQSVPDGYVVSCKPRLGDLIFVPRGTARKGTFDNRIQRKHVDFVICHYATMTPQLVVELDDRSHAQADRRDRDSFLDSALQAAGLPILHVPARNAYVPAELRAAIEENLGHPNPSAASAASSAAISATPPKCPNCQAAMVLRRASKGARKGSSFWGCQNYPNCRTMLPAD